MRYVGGWNNRKNQFSYAMTGKRKTPSWLHLLLLVFFFLLQLSPLLQSSQEQQTCSNSDLKALEGFAAGLGSGAIPGWDFGSSSSSNCCLWVGITCASSSSSSVSRVAGLNLSSMNLNGSVSASLAELGSLQTLNLSRNSLSGDVPDVLFRLLKLEIFDLSLNGFTGDVPTDCNLPAIREFNISFNSFNGSSHPILTGSTFLTTLDITANNFNGAIHAAGLCNNSSPPSSSQVRQLHFSENRLVGDFPVGFGNCRLLQVLHLDSNIISGGLPSDLFGLSSLRELHVQKNLLAGVVDPRLGNLSKLTSLDLSSNQFNGTLPSFLSKLPAIRVLNIRNNSIVGSISNLGDFTSMPHLSLIDLASNNLTGGIPDQLSSCVGLRTLNLAKNNLSGEVPGSFANLKELSSLSLSINSFTNISSAMIILQRCPNLTSLVLTRNFIGETLPADLGIVDGFPKLSLLVIANCGLTGRIPPWLANLSNLQLVDFSWNHFHGRIPEWFGHFDSLFYLDLSNNSLSGEIPLSLTKAAWFLGNNTSQDGTVSAALSVDLPFFRKRKDSVEGFQYNQLTSFPPSLCLSHNKLSGSISAQFGNLEKLQVFDLSVNNLTGTIPDELSKMSSLETVDFSFNRLTGGIPPSLTKLNFLSEFSVAHNNLSGPVPTGGQFLTFRDSSFVGNSHLCSDRSSLSPCRDNDDDDNGVQPAKKGNKGVVIATGLGVVCGVTFILAFVYLFLTRAHSGRIQGIQGGEETVEMDSDAQEQVVVLFQNKGNSNGKEITVDDILKSTSNFDQANIIGCGGFGLVYKATLPNGQKMAIKRLSSDFGQMDREFQAEIETLSRALHENLVVLQGYCRMASVRILMYSYMENGSLDFWLHENNNGESVLDWGMRLRIAKGASKGLEYLHLNCQPHIIHRDIKSSNILLDENFKAHLADFGLARLIRPYDTHVTTDLVGTLGYIPPEYGHASIATLKGDIYSFGVVLLELVTGRRPVDMCQPRGQRELFTTVVQKKKENRVSEVLDFQIYNKQNDKQMERVLEIACLCLSENPKDRPFIEQVVSWLDDVAWFFLALMLSFSAWINFLDKKKS